MADGSNAAHCAEPKPAYPATSEDAPNSKPAPKIDTMRTPLDTITQEINGYTVRIRVHHDEGMGPPWEEHDGHGPVSDWFYHRPSSWASCKRPGQRVISKDGHNARFYDWQEATRIAKRDGWGLSDDVKMDLAKKLGRNPTRGEITAEAVRRDFEHLRARCNDEWHWLGYTTTITAPDGTEHDGDSCWGYEGKTYMIEEAEGSAEAFVANIIETAKATGEALCWP